MAHRVRFLPLLAALLGGCGGPAMHLALDARTAQVRTLNDESDRVTPLVDQEEVFPTLRQMLKSAEHSIQIEMFLFGGKVGQDIVDILLAKKKAGVSVQLLLDPKLGVVGDARNEEKALLKYMKAQGLSYRTFPTGKLPKGPTWLSNVHEVAHAKIVVVDAHVAMLGGMNFLDAGAVAHDYMARIDGPTAWKLAQTVQHDFLAAGGQAAPDGEWLKLPPAPRRAATIRIAETGLQGATIRDLLVAELRAARQSVFVEQLFLDHQDVTAELIAAKRRGCDVRVILDGDAFHKFAPKLPLIRKIPLQGIGNLAAASELTAQGVPVALYKPNPGREYLHAKLVVIDRRTVLIGSANFTYQAMTRNREILAAVDDPNAAARLMAVCEDDWSKHAAPIQGLSRWQRFLAYVQAKVRDGVFRPDEEENIVLPEPVVASALGGMAP